MQFIVINSYIMTPAGAVNYVAHQRAQPVIGPIKEQN